MSFQWSRADRTVGEGFLRIAREQIAKAIDAAEDASTPPEKRVHEARRRCKKLRALLRLVRPDFDDYAKTNAFVRDAARGLAGARDERVSRGTYADLMAWAGRPIPDAEPADANGGGAESEALATFALQMRALEARTTGWAVDRIDLDTLATGLKHTYRRARWTMRFAERHRTDDAFHEWRKYAKYHWNQLGLLEECAPDVLPSAHKCAGEIADLLGLHHDLAVLGDVLEASPADLGAEVDAEFVRDAIGRRQAELEARFEALGQQAFAETPSALKARFKAYFDGWTDREAAA